MFSVTENIVCISKRLSFQANHWITGMNIARYLECDSKIYKFCYKSFKMKDMGCNNGISL